MYSNKLYSKVSYLVDVSEIYSVVNYLTDVIVWGKTLKISHFDKTFNFEYSDIGKHEMQLKVNEEKVSFNIYIDEMFINIYTIICMYW